MELVVFTKLITDFSFYFMFASFFGSMFSLNRVMTVPMLIFAAAAFFCWLLRKQKPYIRLLPLLLMGLCLFFADSAAEYVVLALPAVYTALISAKLLFATERGSAIDHLRFGLIFGVVLSIIAAAYINIGVALSGTLTFLLIFALSSVLLIRMLRHDATVLSSRSFKLLNLALLAAVCVLGLLFSSLLFLDGLGTALRFFMSKIISPIFVWIVRGLGYIVSIIGSWLSGVELHENALDDFGKDMSAESLDLKAEDSGRWAGAQYIIFAIVAVIVIIIVIAAIFIFRRMIHGKYRETESGEPISRKVGTGLSGRRRAAHGPREQIREYYRKFLSLCLKRGVTIERSSTSLEINDAASKLFFSDTDSFRSAYIRARYDDKANISPADVKNAKDLYSSIRSDNPGQ